MTLPSTPQYAVNDDISRKNKTCATDVPVRQSVFIARSTGPVCAQALHSAPLLLARNRKEPISWITVTAFPRFVSIAR